LIIFDLDDTLIDTSGYVTPFKMKECLKRFIEAGLAISDFDKAYLELLSINAKSKRSQDALAQFLHQVGGSGRLFEKAIQEMTAPLPSGFSVPTTPNAKEILKYLSKTHTIALVTGGHPPFQMEKLEKAGIDRTIFSKIAIPEDSIKKPFYEGLVREFSLSADQVLVCGDRIAMDLVPAFELGFTTVHMRWGRGSLSETEKWVHHAISDLSELKRIIKT
jgi:FMN phosphatase YigB (HAD superfamily)